MRFVKGRFLFFAMVVAFLTACQSNYDAPVVEGWQTKFVQASRYRVQKYDTLYSIAFAFNQDYRVLAAENHLAPSGILSVGQWLRMSNPSRLPRPVHLIKSKQVPRDQVRRHVAPDHAKHVTYEVRKPRKAHETHKLYKVREKRTSRFVAKACPAKGYIVSRFTGTYTGNKGVDIKGYYGSPIRAVSSGVVVYRGQGVRGYRQLIIIKHNRHYLSAYANNAKILVRQGQTVHAGQLIAKMGRDNAGRTRLHFELRRRGLSVNPRYLLPRKCVYARR